MMRRTLSLVAVLTGAFGMSAACGGSNVNAISPAETDSGPTAEASVSGDAVSANESDARDNAADSSIVDAPANGPCPADHLCFDVTPVRPGTAPLAGRLVVVWAQLNDDGADPQPLVAYDAAFAGTETRVSIPLASITAPDEVNLLCKRDCDDESICGCTEEPKVGTGYVIVVADDNGNGKADIAVKRDDSEPFIGAAMMAVGYSAKAFVPAPFPFDRIFPDGIEAGARGYSLVRPEGGPFDRMGNAAAGTVFSLGVCDSLDQDVCTPKFPNLT